MSECKRLEKDWDTYKLRVKSMLHAKDNEIKTLQDGLDFTEDTKMLMEQIDGLKYVMLFIILSSLLNVFY